MAENRLYTDKETSRILQRALELQHRQKAQEPSVRGLSLDELAAAGREAGIDPEFIRQAALSLGNRPTRLSGWAGGPPSLHLEGTLDRVCGEDALKDLQLQMGMIFQGPGNGLVHKGRFAWDAQPGSSTPQLLPWHVQVFPEGGRTRVTLEVDLKVWAWALHGGLVGGLGLGTGIPAVVTAGLGVGDPLVSALVVAGALSGSYGLAWLLYRWTVGWARKTGTRILDRILGSLGE